MGDGLWPPHQCCRWWLISLSASRVEDITILLCKGRLSSCYALANSQWLELFEFIIWNSDQPPLLGLLVAVAHMPAQQYLQVNLQGQESSQAQIYKTINQIKYQDSYGKYSINHNNFTVLWLSNLLYCWMIPSALFSVVVIIKMKHIRKTHTTAQFEETSTMSLSWALTALSPHTLLMLLLSCVIVLFS